MYFPSQSSLGYLPRPLVHNFSRAVKILTSSAVLVVALARSYTIAETVMADPAAISQQFTQYYYSVFDTDRKNLGTLYVRPTIPYRIHGTQI